MGDSQGAPSPLHRRGSSNHDGNYSCKEDLEERICEDKERINDIRQQFFGLCCGNPRELLICEDIEGGKFDPIEMLTYKFDDLWKELLATVTLTEDRRLVAENWDKHKEG